MNRHPTPVAKFIDQYEEHREIHRLPNGELRVKRQRSGVAQDLGRAVSLYFGQRVREERLKLKLSMEGLARRAGLSPSKMRIQAIEKAMDGGPKVGTIYALAVALGVPVESMLPDAATTLSESGVSMVGDMQLYTREEVTRMVRAIGGPVAIKRAAR